MKTAKPEETLKIVGRSTTLDYAINDAIRQCEQNNYDCQSMRPNSPPVRIIYSPSVQDGEYSQMEETEFGSLEVKTFTHHSVDEDIEVSLSFDVRS